MIDARTLCSLLLATTACFQSVAADESPILEIPLSSYGETSLHCGLHALIAVAVALDKPIPVNSLFADGRFMSSSSGSSISDLVAASKENKLFTKVVTGITSRELSASSSPALLLIDSQASGFKHWIAYLGHTSDGRFEIYDSDEGNVSKDAVELDVFWDGTCLLVGDSESQVNLAAFWMKMTAHLTRLSFLLSTIALVLIAARSTSGSSQGSSLFRSGFAILTIAALTTLLLVSQQDLKPLPEIIANRGCWGTALTLQTESQEEFIRDIPKRQDVLLVDCRLSIDYQSGHIPNAVNVPANSGFHQWIQFKKRISKNQHIVLYCQSAQCGWAESSRQRLECLGIKASVLAGGYERYSREGLGDGRNTESTQQNH